MSPAILVMSPAILVMSPGLLVMSPGLLVMSPGLLVMSPALLVMSPANAEQEIANVSSDAQRIDLKLFILILLVSNIYFGNGALGMGWQLDCQVSFLACRLCLFAHPYFKVRAIGFSRVIVLLNS